MVETVRKIIPKKFIKLDQLYKFGDSRLKRMLLGSGGGTYPINISLTDLVDWRGISKKRIPILRFGLYTKLHMDLCEVIDGMLEYMHGLPTYMLNLEVSKISNRLCGYEIPLMMVLALYHADKRMLYSKNLEVARFGRFAREVYDDFITSSEDKEFKINSDGKVEYAYYESPFRIQRRIYDYNFTDGLLSPNINDSLLTNDRLRNFPIHSYVAIFEEIVNLDIAINGVNSPL